MDYYPELSTNHINSYTLDSFILATYPGFIAFGNPDFVEPDNNLKFNLNSYIKIIPYVYKEWIHLLKKCMKHNVKQTTNLESPLQIQIKELQYVIFESNNTLLKCVSLNNNYSLILMIKTNKVFEETFKITLNLFQLVEFYKGLDVLYFTPFILPKPIYLIFRYLVFSVDQEEIEILNFSNIIDFSKKACRQINITSLNIEYNVADMILRYKTTLLDNLTLKQLIP